MADKETIKELLEASTGGTITAKQVTAAGLHRSVLQELVKCGELYRYGRGIYVHSNAWEDDLYLLQCKYGRGIYSNDTALYLLGYSDRTPIKYTMTFPKGYNTPSLKQQSSSDLQFRKNIMRYSARQWQRHSNYHRCNETLCSFQR